MRNAPVLMFSRNDRYSPVTTRHIVRVSDNVPVFTKPVARSLAREHSFFRDLILAHYSCRCTSPVCIRAQGSKPCEFTIPFLSVGRLLPLSGFSTTTTPCLRAVMGDADVRLRLSLLGWSHATFSLRAHVAMCRWLEGSAPTGVARLPEFALSMSSWAIRSVRAPDPITGLVTGLPV